MTATQWRLGRKGTSLTQAQAARALHISQPYLSQLEKGTRIAPRDLARRAMDLYTLPPTVLPVRQPDPERAILGRPDFLQNELASLGYPGFARVSSRSTRNPAELLFDAITQPDLEVRLVEALPWVVNKYPDLNWPWLRDEVKLRNLQNRLGYILHLAKETYPESGTDFGRLCSWENDLEEARLAREGTLCRESMPQRERVWLRAHRPSAAEHWNLLTSLAPEQLSYAAK